MDNEFDFLHADNLCGQTLLKLVSRGNSILAELLRLSYHTPPVFLGSSSLDDPANEKYIPVLFDFSYLKAPSNYEAAINRDLKLVALNEEFQENHLSVMERFYSLFDNIWKYIKNFNEFIDHLNEGFYISHTIEDVLLNVDGKQLMCEALYLFGVMLLTLDRLVPGPAREKIIVAYYRYKGESALENFEQVTRLCRNTGFVPGRQRPKNYPEDYFSRFKVPREVVRMIIDRLRSDDVYSMIKIYPTPEHRSTALSSQASMLYVILYFAPNILHRQRTTMREIVDKHFNDNWIITVYMGWVINLREVWVRYPSAHDALRNTLLAENVTDFSSRHAENLYSCEKMLSKYLTQGVLEDEYVLDHINPLLHCLRKCNVTVRWLMLHYRESDKKLHDLVVDQNIPSARIMRVLLHTAQLEFQLKKIFTGLLDGKETRWENCRKQSMEMMEELSEVSRAETLTRVKANADLQEWFSVLASQIESLGFDKSRGSKTGRKIQKLLEALHDVEQFEQIDTSLQIKEFLALARGYLTQMVKAVNVKEDILVTLDQISDFSYAWEMISDAVPYLHQLVEDNPNAVVLLRATFQKLASILDVPLIRINQAGSKDVVSVAHYYSNELVEFVRRVLEVIPKKVFSTLRDLIDLQTHRMKPLPVRLELVNAGEFAQLQHRYELAKLTHEVSVFTEGILKMEQTLLGVIEVDPRKVLEDGIRKELAFRVGRALHSALNFPTHHRTHLYSVAQVEKALDDVGNRLDGFRRSFEYIQDYIDIYGLKIWQEECSRVLAYNTEQECNRYIKKKILDSQSAYQKRATPIPRFKPTDRLKKYPNFMGRLCAAILGLTDARITVYAPECTGWYQLNGAEVAGISLFSRINRGVGVFGMAGLDTVLAFRIVRDLQRLTGVHQAAIQDGGILQFLTDAEDALSPFHSVPISAKKVYASLEKKLRPHLDKTLEFVLRVGQAQLLRKSLRNELNFTAKLDSQLLYSTLEAFNDSLLTDINAHYKDQKKPYPDATVNPVLSDVGAYLEAAGMYDPLQKIYVTMKPLSGFPIFLFTFVIYHLPQLVYDPHFGSLIRIKSKIQLDGAPLVVGITCVLKQLHPTYTKQFIGLIGQYVRSSVHVTMTGKQSRKVKSLPQHWSREIGRIKSGDQRRRNMLRHIRWSVRNFSVSRNTAAVNNQYIPDKSERSIAEQSTVGRSLKSNTMNVNDSHWNDDSWSSEELRVAASKHVVQTWGPSKPVSSLPQLSHGEGVYLYDTSGKQYLDWTSQAVCSNLGHSVPPRIKEAVEKQMEKLPFVYGGLGVVECRVRLAQLLSELSPGDINSFVFASSGSEANECAIRLARRYTGRQKILNQYRSYHGGSTTSLTATGDFRRWFAEAGTSGFVKMFNPQPFGFKWGDTDEEKTEILLSMLEEQIKMEGPNEIAAVMMESIVGAGGVLVPPVGYLEGVRALCDKYEILLILDEVMVGFGRTGQFWGFQHFDNVVPDIFTSAKGLSAAYLPISMVGMRQKLKDFVDETPLGWGATYANHPVAMACAYESVKHILREGLVENAAKLEPVMVEEMQKLCDKHKSIRQARAIGLFGCFDLIGPDGNLVQQYQDPRPEQVTKLHQAMIGEGLIGLFRPPLLHCAPPLVIEEDELRDGFERLSRAMKVSDGYM
eukprot:g2473.t1